MADGVSKIVLGTNAKWRSTTNKDLVFNPIHMYDEQTILDILKQDGCVGLRLEVRNLESYTPLGKAKQNFKDQNSYFLVGVNRNNINMTNDNNTIAAPCPDICVIGD